MTDLNTMLPKFVNSMIEAGEMPTQAQLNKLCDFLYELVKHRNALLVGLKANGHKTNDDRQEAYSVGIIEAAEAIRHIENYAD